MIEKSLEAMENEILDDSIDEKIQNIMQKDPSPDITGSNGSEREMTVSNQMENEVDQDNSTEYETENSEKEAILSEKNIGKSEMMMIREGDTECPKKRVQTEMKTNDLISPGKVEKQWDSNDKIDEPNGGSKIKYPTHNFNDEIINWESPSILNICNESEVIIEPISKGKECAEKIVNPTDKIEVEECLKNVRPIIEVLSDLEAPEFEATIDSKSKLNEMLMDETQISRGESSNDSRVDSFSIDYESPSNGSDVNSTANANGSNTSDTQLTIVEFNSVAQPHKLKKSSAITFFCENLDELKRTGGDSDESSEEI